MLRRIATLSLLALSLTGALQAQAFDESYNFQPGLGIYQQADWLKDLIGAKGSQLCGPISLTHRFTYFKYWRATSFANLASAGDVDNDGTANTYSDLVRHFFRLCNTSVEEGTRYHSLLNCGRQYMQDSGYNHWFYMIGPHSPDGPNGDTTQTRGMVGTDQIRYYTANDAIVIMGIGWYKLNDATRVWERTGGHIFNVYGYDYDQAWGKSRITLKVVNSYLNYEGRAKDQMFDSVEMTAVPNDGTTYPEMVGYQLRGPGFDFQYAALVEDIWVGLPLAR